MELTACSHPIDDFKDCNCNECDESTFRICLDRYQEYIFFTLNADKSDLDNNKQKQMPKLNEQQILELEDDLVDLNDMIDMV